MCAVARLDVAVSTVTAFGAGVLTGIAFTETTSFDSGSMRHMA